MIDEVKKHLPEPVYDAEPSLKDLYYKTWKFYVAFLQVCHG